MEQLEQRFAAEDAKRKETEMEKDKSGEIRDMFKGAPPKNVIISVDDLPPKTLEQHLKECQKGQKSPKSGRKTAEFMSERTFGKDDYLNNYEPYGKERARR